MSDRHTCYLFIYRKKTAIECLFEVVRRCDPFQIYAMQKVDETLQHLKACNNDHECAICDAKIPKDPEVLIIVISKKDLQAMAITLCDAHKDLDDRPLASLVAQSKVGKEFDINIGYFDLDNFPNTVGQA